MNILYIHTIYTHIIYMHIYAHTLDKCMAGSVMMLISLFLFLNDALRNPVTLILNCMYIKGEILLRIYLDLSI